MNEIRTIQQIVKSYYTVSGESLESLIRHVELVTIPKGTQFVKAGGVDDHDYFLLSGICRSFVKNHKGEDVSISFYQDETVLTPNVARSLENRSTISFESLTDLRLGKFKAIELVYLMREKPDLRNFANAVLQRELKLKSEKEVFNASLTAKERLIRFRDQFRALENQVPHPTIASYLGITNISLSRLRKELSRE